MGVLLRGKMLARIRRLQREGPLGHPGQLEDPEVFERLMTRLAQVSWLVYARRPFRRIEHVLGYLGQTRRLRPGSTCFAS